MKDIHPTELSDILFLGYSEALISVSLTKDVREIIYKKGFTCNNRKYVRYKRSASSAKDGKCLFILSDLKDIMNKWSNCGLNFVQGTDSELTSWEAYTALTLSGIQETFSIPRKSILLIRDLKSTFKTSGIRVGLDNTELDREQLCSHYSEDIEIENIIWDGECLIDESLFDQLSSDFSSKHMLLLRNRFFKSCGFKTRLQKWFKDNQINDPRKLNGYTTAKRIEDIKIVITESSLKYLKFFDGDKNDALYLKKALQAWFIGLGNSHKLVFGIVKSDAPSRYWNGKMVRTNYQLLNTLGLSEEETYNLLKPTIDYIEKVKDQPIYFKHFLEHELSFTIEENDPHGYDSGEDGLEYTNSFENNLFYFKDNTIKEMLSISDKVFQTRLSKTVLNRRMDRIKKAIARGRFLIPGTYSTLFGNPIELLVSIITPDYILPTTPSVIKITVNGIDVQYPTLSNNEVYTTMFADGEELCGARSPHITMGNLFLCKNTYLINDNGKSIIQEYFDLSPQIICVNSINYNLLQMLNGADFDSDTMLITNQRIVVEALKRQGDLFAIPINKVDEDNRKRKNGKGKKDLSFSNQNEHINRLIEIDNKIANNIIGEIVNCSQLLNSILWTRFPNVYDKNHADYNSFKNDELYNFICELEVLSNIEIDKAKRNSLNNPQAEYNRLKHDAIAYQLRPTSEGFVAEYLPEYLVEARNSKWSKTICFDENDKKYIYWNGIYFKKSGEAEHKTTLKYVYDLANNINNASPKSTIPFSALITPIEGPNRNHVDIFNRLKIICAFYHLKIRTSHFIFHNGSYCPDYGKCSHYVFQCYQAVNNIVLSSKNQEFVIYSIIKELDDFYKHEDSQFIVINLYNRIKTWSPNNQRKFSKSKELINTVESIIEENNSLAFPKKKLPIYENYGDLLLSALFNVKNVSGSYPLREMMKCKQTVPVESLHYNESNGDDYIYEYRFERVTSDKH